MIRPGFAAVFLLVAGCATVESGGFTVDQADAETAFASVRSRFTFETGCPAKDTELVVLDVMKNAVPNLVSLVGATGCDQRLVYVRTPSGWVLDSAGRDSPPAAERQPSPPSP